MQRALTVLATGLVMAAAAHTASAVPTINVGDINLEPNKAGQVRSFQVSGGDQVSGLNLFVQVGDGGPNLADFGLVPGTNAPAITDVNLKPTGGIFANVDDPQNDLQSIPQVKNSTIALSTGSVSADGKLLELTFDTSGFDTIGESWDLRFQNVLPDDEVGGPFATDFAGTDANITNGQITITPEAGTFALVGLGAGLVFWRRSRSVTDSLPAGCAAAA